MGWGVGVPAWNVVVIGTRCGTEDGGVAGSNQGLLDPFEILGRGTLTFIPKASTCEV